MWDIDRSLPRLERTLARMNAAQAEFGFEVVDLSMPLDAWDGKTRRGEPYLNATTFANRLKSATVALRVNALVCLTRHWLRDDDWLNLWGWWPDDGAPPVTVLSYAGIPGLRPEGPETERALANGVVITLSGLLSRRGAHARGPRSCPFYFNADRSFELLAGAQAFDARCRREMLKLVGKSQTRALEALLVLFHGNTG